MTASTCEALSVNELSPPLLLPLDVVSLTMSLVNVPSISQEVGPLADAVEAALTPLPHLEVERFGTTVVARTDQGHAERVVIAGRLDTGPGSGSGSGDDTPLAYVEMGKLFGLGACEVKGGLAIMLKAAALRPDARDVTFVFYDRGIDPDPDAADGLEALAALHPDRLRAGVALLLAPTGVEVGGSGLSHPTAQRLAALAETAGDPGAGDAELAVFTALGVPAVSFGPGDLTLAATADAYVTTAELTRCEWVLKEWLQG